MLRLLFGLTGLLWIVGAVAAQDAPLTAQDTTVASQTGIYGQESLVAQGVLVNGGDQPYTDVALTAEVYDADDQLIGEGVGYLVNACGAGLLPDFALEPGATQQFAVPLELDDDG